MICQERQGISIHALLAESDSDQGASNQTAQQISIHALLAESDVLASDDRTRTTISIHALLAESDGGNESSEDANNSDFYPRSPCGERPITTMLLQEVMNFYPRSPCGERPVCAVAQSPASRFLSTLSLRRATPFSRCVPMMRPYFYPRSPCGERRILLTRIIGFSGFLSTLSLRRATAIIILVLKSVFISIHALLAESDMLEQFKQITETIFLSTLSLRRAT